MLIWHRSLRRVTFASGMMIKVGLGQLLIIIKGDRFLSCMCSNIVEIRSEVTLLFLDAALEILMSCCPSCRCGECDEQYCVSAVDPGDREAGGSH